MIVVAYFPLNTTLVYLQSLRSQDKLIVINFLHHMNPTIPTMRTVVSILACSGLSAFVSAHSASPLSTHQQTQLHSASIACSKSIHCLLTPESFEGPFYVSRPLIRSSIAEDRDGFPFALEIDLMDVTTCKPAVGVMVDIWHASVQGEYSGWARTAEGSSQDSLKKRGTPVEDSRWLRGVQPSDMHGRVGFDTIIPGWYPGRATHIHVKIHVGNVTVDDGVLLGGGNMSHTGQFFFSDGLITNLSKTHEPYISRRKQMKPVLNGDDGQYLNNGGAQQVITVTKHGGSYTGKVTVGIDPNADHHPKGGHGPPGGSGGHHGPHKGHKGGKKKAHRGHKNGCHGKLRSGLKHILGFSVLGAIGAIATALAVRGLRKYLKTRAERRGYIALRQDEPSTEEVN